MFVSNLKAVRKAAGLTQEAASKKSGIPLGTLRRWEQGVNEPDMQSVINLAKLYGVSTDTLLGSIYADSEIPGIIKPAYSVEADVPLIDAIAANTPIETIARNDTHPIPSTMHARYPRAFLLKVSGRSMDRVIPNGCYALVDPCDTVEVDNAPYAVCVNGFDPTIMRMRKLNNGFELIPDSTDPTFEPHVYNYNEPDTETVTIIGRIVWCCFPYDCTF